MSSLETLEGLWQARPCGLAFAALAEGLHGAGRTEEAQGVLEEGVRRWPRHLAGRLVQGRIAKDRGDVEGARSAFQVAVDLDGSCRNALEGLAESSARGQYFRQAFDAWSRLAALEPDHPQAADRARELARKLDAPAGFDAIAAVHEQEDERSREALSEGAGSHGLSRAASSHPAADPGFRLDLADIPMPSPFSAPQLDGPTIPELPGFQIPSSLAATSPTFPFAPSQPLAGKAADSSFATLEMPSFPAKVIPPPPLEIPHTEAATATELKIPAVEAPHMAPQDMEAEATQFIAARPQEVQERGPETTRVTGDDIGNRLDEVFGTSSHTLSTSPAASLAPDSVPGQVTGNDVEDRLGQLFGDSSVSPIAPSAPSKPAEPIPTNPVSENAPTVESVPVVPPSGVVVSGDDIEDRLDDLFGESVLDLTRPASGPGLPGGDTSAVPREDIVPKDVLEKADETTSVERDTTFEARLAIEPLPGSDSTTELRTKDLDLGGASRYVEQAIQGSEIDPAGSTIDLPALDAPAAPNATSEPARSTRLTTDDVDSRLDELFASSEFLEPPSGARTGFAPRPSVAPGPVGPGVTGDDIEGRLDDLFGSDSDFPVGLPTVTFAEEYLRQGHPEQAASIYRQLLEKDPGNAELKRRLSEIEGRS